MTPSERRLHPVSVLFSLGGSLKAFAIPALLLFFGARSAGRGPFPFGNRTFGDANWEAWAIWLLIPITLAAVVRYLTFRMRYEGAELVIRSGLFFRNERHIPYARIQNLNSIQNVFHRILGMTDVQIETGSGQKAEATISVVPLAVLEEMRDRVFAARAATTGHADAASGAGTDRPAPTVLLRLPFRELAVLSLIQNRGLLPIAALFGLLWEFGLYDSVATAVGSERFRPTALVQDAVAGSAAGAADPWRIAGALGVVAGAIALIQGLSLAWVVIRLHGFTLTAVGEDLRTNYGLLTRVATTVPLRRIQTLTIVEGPLQRFVSRVAIRVQTAGGGSVPTGGMTVEFGEGGDGGGGRRQWLAPIVRGAEAPALVHAVVPEFDERALDWHPPAPRAFRRALKPNLLLALLPVPVAVGWWGPWALGALPLTVGWAWLATRQQIRRMAWSRTDDVVAFRSGWIWRRTIVARTVKIQVVTRVASPWDRRAAMARVRVDTAGGGEFADRVDIPYLACATADELYRDLAARAATTEFRW